MRPTSRHDDSQLTDRIAIDTTDLMKLLSCGRMTAKQIGESANAKITIGRRVLWNADKIKAYLAEVAR